MPKFCLSKFPAKLRRGFPAISDRKCHRCEVCLIVLYAITPFVLRIRDTFIVSLMHLSLFQRETPWSAVFFEFSGHSAPHRNPLAYWSCHCAPPRGRRTRPQPRGLPRPAQAPPLACAGSALRATACSCMLPLAGLAEQAPPVPCVSSSGSLLPWFVHQRTQGRRC
jgi:hypothetical protein